MVRKSTSPQRLAHVIIALDGEYGGIT
jgi:hypothetical protein